MRRLTTAENFPRKDPSVLKRERRQRQKVAADETFEHFARQWLEHIRDERAPATYKKLHNWVENSVIPAIGHIQMRRLRPQDVLFAAQKFEQRGAIDSAHRIKQLCGQICRYCIALDVIEEDVTRDLRGALKTPKTEHYATLTDPREVGQLMRRIYCYSGYPWVTSALKLAPLVFVRPGELRTAE